MAIIRLDVAMDSDCCTSDVLSLTSSLKVFTIEWVSSFVRSREPSLPRVKIVANHNRKYSQYERFKNTVFSPPIHSLKEGSVRNTMPR